MAANRPSCRWLAGMLRYARMSWKGLGPVSRCAGPEWPLSENAMQEGDQLLWNLHVDDELFQSLTFARGRGWCQ